MISAEQRPLVDPTTRKSRVLVDERPIEETTVVNETTPKNLIQRQIQRGKSYYKTTVLVTGLLFFFNFCLLYLGTVYGQERINVAKFYGFKEGRHEHLQRSMGIACLVMFLINMFPLLKDEEHGKNSMLVFSAVCNCIVIIHYLLETLWFVGMRIEVMAIQAFVLLVNMYWSYVDFAERRKVKALQGKDPEDAHRDESLRSKLSDMKADNELSSA